MFENLSRMEILRKMAKLCQASADETMPGAEQLRLQLAAEKFRDEAASLATPLQAVCTCSPE